ncbi:hypothetical protein D3C79_959670 [compost metagenome]
MLDPIELNGGLRHCRQLRGALSGDGLARLQRLIDGAELASAGRIVHADAMLQQCGRQHVLAVQRGDFPVRDAIVGAQPVEVRDTWYLNLADLAAFAENQRFGAAVVRYRAVG